MATLAQCSSPQDMAKIISCLSTIARMTHITSDKEVPDSIRPEIRVGSRISAPILPHRSADQDWLGLGFFRQCSSSSIHSKDPNKKIQDQMVEKFHFIMRQLSSSA
ncbi:hypothetical protein Fot_06201 [Forsythia ovata]|uniref:Uncharacterized protein n=1 Tax=Forsythia ovata TaxID=205694 RepID=A0ABD1WSA5_9LAMI